MSRRRLDKEMIRRELASTRNQAQELIESGQVLVNGDAREPVRAPDLEDSLLLPGATLGFPGGIPSRADCFPRRHDLPKTYVKE